MDETKTVIDTYGKIAERYAELVNTAPYNVYLERPAIRALVPDIQGTRVLDAGCGPGTNISWLLERGAQKVVGIDASRLSFACGHGAYEKSVPLAHRWLTSKRPMLYFSHEAQSFAQTITRR